MIRVIEERDEEINDLRNQISGGTNSQSTRGNNN
jgi:hypothetical protein